MNNSRREIVNGREYESTQLKESPFSDLLTLELLERWAQMPLFAENDPEHPEWKETPTIPLDLRSDGYGEVLVKNEASTESNPTGTMKDRAAWECATLYRTLAHTWLMQSEGNPDMKTRLAETPVPRMSVITSGNEGRALASCFARFGLPPPHLLVSPDSPKSYIDELTQLNANIFAAPLGDTPLSAQSILNLTDNPQGISLCQTPMLRPDEIFYDWLVHETFNQSPQYIFLPYGSGRLMENFHVWQMKTAHNAELGKSDPRLRCDPSTVLSMHICAAEPERLNSSADKLPAPFKPFINFNNTAILNHVQRGSTGEHSGRYSVSEDYIDHAYELMTRHGIPCEPSGSASLALYLEQYDAHRFNERNPLHEERVLIVNSGLGLFERQRFMQKQTHTEICDRTQSTAQE